MKFPAIVKKQNERMIAYPRNTEEVSNIVKFSNKNAHKFDVPGAETFFQLQNRALAAIRDIYFKHAGQLVALVSHGALIKTVLAHIEGRHMAQLWTPPQMHNCAHSIVCVDAEDNYRILQYADQPYDQ